MPKPRGIDVQVLTSGRFGAIAGVVDKHSANALATRLDRDHHILQPRMNQAIPQHVDETDEFRPLPGDHPAQTVPGWVPTGRP